MYFYVAKSTLIYNFKTAFKDVIVLIIFFKTFHLPQDCPPHYSSSSLTNSPVLELAQPTAQIAFAV